MASTERQYGVWLYERRVGLLRQRGDYTRFAFDEAYLADPQRAVLGLYFEQDLRAGQASALRLPPWFSNLLPEGRLREWIAADRGVSPAREMELLAQVGHDLPGAVRVLPDEADDDASVEPTRMAVGTPDDRRVSDGWRFSLAGVGLKFSMLRHHDRLTLPAHGEGGDWIVKLPDSSYDDVPLNEFAVMSLAAAVGIEVPEIQLVHRDRVDSLPPGVWPGAEEWCFAIRRFDRDAGRCGVHIEDLAQVRNFYPDRKYDGNYETVAALIYRQRDLEALREFVRRVTFCILVSNGDAHLKNWSLIYRDRRVPTLSPAYDLVSTAAYRTDGEPEDLGLKLGGTRRFGRIGVKTFDRLERRLRAPGDAQLAAVAAETAERTRASWPEHSALLAANPALRDSMSRSIEAHSRTLLG
jgi:serine/threonine-protein kinase HipA